MSITRRQEPGWWPGTVALALAGVCALGLVAMWFWEGTWLNVLMGLGLLAVVALALVDRLRGAADREYSRSRRGRQTRAMIYVITVCMALVFVGSLIL